MFNVGKPETFRINDFPAINNSSGEADIFLPLMNFLKNCAGFSLLGVNIVLAQDNIRDSKAQKN